MYILHIETATSICSVALSNRDQLISLRETSEGMNHTARLAPMIDGILKENGLTTNDLGAISVSSGPGSYTGLRVGGSTAKAFAYSLDIPLVAVPTLQALASAAQDLYPDASHFLPMIDARRNEVYASLFSEGGTQLWPDSSILVDEEFLMERLSHHPLVICCGDGAFKVNPYLNAFQNLQVAEKIQCSAKHLIRPAIALLGEKMTEDPLHFVPSYLKPPNITQPKKMA